MPRSGVATSPSSDGAPPFSSRKIRSFRPISDAPGVRQLGGAVDVERQPQVPATGHDDRHVEPDGHTVAGDLDAAVALAALALGDVVAVRRLQGAPRGGLAAALAAGGARGVLGVVGRVEREVRLPEDQAQQQDRGQHDQQLHRRLPALALACVHSSATVRLRSTIFSLSLMPEGSGTTSGTCTVTLTPTALPSSSLAPLWFSSAESSCSSATVVLSRRLLG